MALGAKRREPQIDGPEHQPFDPLRMLLDGEPRPGSAEIRLTPKAVEMARKALEKRGTPQAALRLGVRGGGCSGVSYAIEFADNVRKRDNVYEYPDLQVVVDPKSLVYLRGSVLDYEVKLMQHGFKFRNPNEKTGCGCGESFGI
jgi:iron-sulfur cluster assembly protein